MATSNPRLQRACMPCRLRKVRCGGSHPCANCIDRNESCDYAPARSRRRPRRPGKYIEKGVTGTIAKQLQPTSSQETQLGGFSILSPGEPQHRISSTARNQARSIDRTESQIAPTPLLGNATIASQSDGSIMEATASGIVTSTNKWATTYCTTGLPGCTDVNVSTNCENGDVQENPNWQYHGPSSFLSICSLPGIDWVSSITHLPGFQEVAKGLSTLLSHRLTSCPKISQDLITEPDYDIAWKFSQAYFDHSFEARLGIVSRPAFENRLKLHFKPGNNNLMSDPAWFALRNTIYASGCRIEMLKSTSSVLNIQACAWKYFEKALSVHTELLFSATGLMAVEALAAMSHYVEGIGAPGIEYMLCSSAVRLAQSKGLHRQPSPIWNLSHEEVQRRNWMFWAIYVYEKHISSRSGRPSVIDDLDVSCALPTSPPKGSTINLEFFIYVVEHAKLSSLIIRNLATAKALRQPLGDLMKTTREMHQKLEEWRTSLPFELQPTAAFIPHNLPAGLTNDDVLYIRYSYAGSLMDIHSVFTSPWNKTVYSSIQSSEIRDQISASTTHAVESARSVILSTNYIELSVATPVWLAVYYPLVSMIKLFIHILQHPCQEGIKANVALMDIGTGHFSRLELVAPQLSIPFAREIASLARTVVEKASKNLPTKEVLPVGVSESRDFTGEQPSACVTDEIQQSAESAESHDALDTGILDDDMNFVDLYSEDWSALLSSFPGSGEYGSSTYPAGGEDYCQNM